MYRSADVSPQLPKTLMVHALTSQMKSAFAARFAGKDQTVVAEADTVREHIFDLLGSGPTKLSPQGAGYQPINWHLDFKSGYQWQKDTLALLVPYGHRAGVDIKVPWELSRFQHLVLLGQAYALTQDAKYAREFENQITDWIDNNPVGFGINWRCAMDIAIRAANWLVAFEFFSERYTTDSPFLRKFCSSLHDHGRFSFSHLENNYGFTSNHYVADLAGLLFIALYCPFFPESSQWLAFAMSELEKEMRVQVYEDGCDYEASTSYHRLVLEMFFYAHLLAKRSGISFSDAFEERLRRMFVFSLYCIKPNGRIPQIGDNDSGRFLIFCKRAVLEHSYLLSLSAIYFGDSQFKRPEFSFDDEAFWVFGERGATEFDAMPVRNETLRSKAFPDAGWYILRSGNNYCFVACGPNGQGGNGGHAHNDKLSFEFAVGNTDVIVDPGTFAYTAQPLERNRYRAMQSHNVIAVDGFEQNSWGKDLFRLDDSVSISGARLQVTDDTVSFTGCIVYQGITHERTITLAGAEPMLRIRDVISCDASATLYWRGHLSYRIDQDTLEITAQRIGSEALPVDLLTIHYSDYAYAPEFGVRLPAVLAYAGCCHAGGSTVLETTIRRTR
jgi:hypothetical protein